MLFLTKFCFEFHRTFFIIAVRDAVPFFLIKYTHTFVSIHSILLVYLYDILQNPYDRPAKLYYSIKISVLFFVLKEFS